MPSSTRSTFKWTGRALIGIAVLVAGLIGLNLYHTYTTRLPSCEHPKGVVTVQSLRHLPQTLREKTLKRLPDLADRSSAFSAGCTGYGAHQRFVTAVRTGARWVIGYEQGGIAYMVKVLTFDRLSTGAFVMSSHRYSSSESFCADINARLRNEPVPGDRRNIAERSF